MIIFSDLVSGDEIISDSFDLKDVDDVVYEVDCAMIEVGADNIDIGANPSAEGGDDEGADDTTKKVNNVANSHRLQYYGDEASRDPIFKTKKDYTAQLKTYLKAVVAKFKEQGKSDDEIKAFQTKVQGYFTKTIAPNFKDYEFYIGESMATDSMVLLLNYREDGVTPYFTIWKHGLSQTKV